MTQTIRRILIAALLAWVAPAFATDTRDVSGTITTGGTDQLLMAKNPGRGAMLVINPDAESERLCVNTVGTASTTAAGNICILPGGSATLRTTAAIRIIAATTGHKFTAIEIDDGQLINPGTSTGGAGGATAAKQDTGNASLANIDSATSRLTSSAGPKTGGAALATTAFMVGGTYNSTPPTITNTQEIGLQVTSSGALIVAGAAGTGSAPSSNPVSVSGVDGGGLKRHFLTMTDGTVQVNDVAALAKYDTVANSSKATSRQPTAEPDGLLGGPFTVAGNTNLYCVDTTGWGRIVHQTTVGGSATINYEGSNDSTDGTCTDGTWAAVSGVAPSNTGGSSFVTITTAAQGWESNLSYKWFRARVSSFSSTPTAYYELRKASASMKMAVGATQSGTWTVQPGNTANTTAWKVDNSAVTQPVSMAGGAATNAKVGDSTGAITDTGDAIFCLRRDGLSSLSTGSPHYLPVQCSKWGALFTEGYEKHARTFSASANITAAATATDILTIVGNATSPVQVTKVTISGVQTTGGQVEVLLINRSTADTGGTCASVTSVAHDNGDSAAAAAVSSCTANPTLGTTVGTVRRDYAFIPAAATVGEARPLVWEFGKEGKPFYLNTSAKGLAVNLNSVTYTGLVLNVTVEWIEAP